MGEVHPLLRLGRPTRGVPGVFGRGVPGAATVAIAQGEWIQKIIRVIWSPKQGNGASLSRIEFPSEIKRSRFSFGSKKWFLRAGATHANILHLKETGHVPWQSSLSICLFHVSTLVGGSPTAYGLRAVCLGGSWCDLWCGLLYPQLFSIRLLKKYVISFCGQCEIEIKGRRESSEEGIGWSG